MYVSSKGFVSVHHDLFRVSRADVGQIEDRIYMGPTTSIKASSYLQPFRIHKARFPL